MTSFSQRGTIMRKIHRARTNKMPGKPKFDSFHLVKIAPKLEWSIDCDHDLIIPKDGQDTSACKISGHSSCILQEMSRNPKFDSFHKVKILPKLEKSTDDDHNLISCGGGQDTSIYIISCHSLYAFSGKYPETLNLTYFTKSKWRLMEENQQTMTIM